MSTYINRQFGLFTVFRGFITFIGTPDVLNPLSKIIEHDAESLKLI